jgi:excisionase family DNA binding protein
MAIKDEMIEHFLSVSQVCAALNLSRPTLYAMLERGDLPSIRLGHLHRIPRRAVEQLLTKAARGKT